MRHKLMIFIIAIVFSLKLTTLQAQTMYVRQQSGAQTAYPINEIQKITFSGGQMQVNQINSITTNYTLSELRYINFTDLTTGTETAETISENLFLYPNPVVTSLNIRLPQTTCEYFTIEIYSLEGKKLHSQKLSQFSGVYSLNVDFLNRGVYIFNFQTNNQVITTKFIKD